MKKNAKVVLSAIVLIFFIVGCQAFHSAHVKPIEKEYKDKALDALKQRSLKYWDLFARRKFAKAYQFEMPHQRFLHSLSWYETFNQKYADANTTFEQLDIKRIDKDRAIVKMKKISPSATYIFDDKWYLIDGIWYHQMKTTVIPLPFDVD